MGAKVSSLSTRNLPIPGKVYTIRDNEFTTDWAMPNEILKQGQPVKVLKSGNLLKSRPQAPDISYTTVMFKDGKIDALFATNLDGPRN